MMDLKVLCNMDRCDGLDKKLSCRKRIHFPTAYFMG